ncbi:hypothetical protein L873DRAFT_369619 [Choiromyces venosus 120613-1]|uniref:Uncharacterized protein n=1 Tax=Choiromyces venosus 120613-1 TaxID=1336337 RepID=A0A3N4JWV4_9PEZI|nr:hypothetical protein L873DRAFT_369619 [Choiromyces venosus 120613-1]
MNRQSDTIVTSKIFTQFGLFIYKCTIGYRFGFSRVTIKKNKIFCSTISYMIFH